MYIAAVTHDIKSNTLEATWLKEVTDENGNVSIQRARCHNYSPSQKAEFLAEVEGGEKWTTAAGWTDEYCAAYTAEQERLAAEAAAIEQARIDAEAAAAAAAEQAAFDAEVARQATIIKAAEEAAKMAAQQTAVGE